MTLKFDLILLFSSQNHRDVRSAGRAKERDRFLWSSKIASVGQYKPDSPTTSWNLNREDVGMRRREAEEKYQLKSLSERFTFLGVFSSRSRGSEIIICVCDTATLNPACFSLAQLFHFLFNYANSLEGIKRQFICGDGNTNISLHPELEIWQLAVNKSWVYSWRKSPGHNSKKWR